MEQKEKQEQQEMKQPYEVPRCECIELEVEQPLAASDGGAVNPDLKSFRVGRD